MKSVPAQAVLERVIAEQAARIADLQRALEHERSQAQRLTKALAREQMLRALPPPAHPNNRDPEPIAAPPEETAPEPPEPVAVPEPPEEGWWGRLWKRLKD